MWLAGTRWQDVLPRRSQDQAGREAILTAGLLIADGAFDTPDLDRVRKPLGWLCSALAVLMQDRVPVCASEAAWLIQQHGPLGAELSAIRQQLDLLPVDDEAAIAMHHRIGAAADAVVDLLHAELDADRAVPYGPGADAVTVAAEHGRGRHVVNSRA